MAWKGFDETQWIPAQQTDCAPLVTKYLNERINIVDNNILIMLNTVRNNNRISQNVQSILAPLLAPTGRSPPPAYDTLSPPHEPQQLLDYEFA